MTIVQARAAALKARQDKALDKLIHFQDAGVTTFRTRIDRGDFAYRYQHTHTDGKNSYGLVSHADAAEAIATRGLAGLSFTAYDECPKLVSDYADTLPLAHTVGYDSLLITEGASA